MSFIADLEPREYPCDCKHLAPRKFEPKNQDADQVSDVKLILRGVTPWDLRNSGLLLAAFREKDEPQQTHLEELDSDPVARDIAAYNGKFEIMHFNSGTRKDSDASHKAVLLSQDSGEETALYPTHGIALKTIAPDEDAPRNSPAVCLELMVKGCHHEVAGLPLLIDGSLRVLFEAKSQQELAADTAANIEEPEDGPLFDTDEELGPPMDDDNPLDPGDSLPVLTSAELTVTMLEALPPGAILQIGPAAYIRQTGGGSSVFQEQGSQYMHSAADVLAEHESSERDMAVFYRDADGLPGWAQKVWQASSPEQKPAKRKKAS